MSAKNQVGHTEIVFILDQSGSMCGLTDDTIGGFNSMIEKNLDEAGEDVVTTVLFNNKSWVLHDRVSIHEVPRLTREKYCCSGCTALLDAVGETIVRQEIVQRAFPAPYKAAKVLFIITTDGMENASVNYTYEKVKSMIELHRAEGWEFLFMGANIDAASEAQRMGIARECAASYVSDQRGTEVLYGAIGTAVACARSAEPGVPLSGEWRTSLDRDIKSRDSSDGKSLLKKLASLFH